MKKAELSLGQPIDGMLRLGMKCNFNCIFCNILNHENFPELSFEEAKEEVDKLADHYTYISISGGEPLLYPYVEELVAYAAQEKGMKINLQTNASLISRRRARKLKEAGVYSVFVNLPSHEPEVYARLTSTSRRMFFRVLKGIQMLIDAEIPLIINIVINELNYRALLTYLDFIHEHFPETKEVVFSVIQPQGNAKINSFLVPDYRVIAPYIHKAVRKAQKLGFTVENPFCGLPMCMSPPEELGINSELRAGYLAREGKIPEALMKVVVSKMQPKGCYRCYLKNFCLGIWKEYFEIKGDVVEPPYEVFRYWPTG